MHIRYLLILPISFLYNIGYTQTSNTISTLAARVERFATGLPQEKVYLHIDNTCYFVGDTVWYKA
ncbi:hypothetical protein, partial [Paraprevotella xylaniphila]|uniref:hypothetical protein n=1 Tax=Paraprevotella xylaniphila TaxID=454155 RepID=UPI0039F4E9B0